MKVFTPDIVIDETGMAATHNYPCPIYENEHAVYVLNTGTFIPSWKAQLDGWQLIKFDSQIKKLILRFLL